MARLVGVCLLAAFVVCMFAGCRTYYGIGQSPTPGNYFLTGRDTWGINKIWEARYENGRFKILRTVELGW